MSRQEQLNFLAVNVMGFRENAIGKWSVFERDANPEITTWNPFESYAHALMLIEKMLEQGWELNLEKVQNPTRVCAGLFKYGHKEERFVWAPSIPEALTLVVLRALDFGHVPGAILRLPR
jgi:hypothetical protein